MCCAVLCCAVLCCVDADIDQPTNQDYDAESRTSSPVQTPHTEPSLTRTRTRRASSDPDGTASDVPVSQLRNAFPYTVAGVGAGVYSPNRAAPGLRTACVDEGVLTRFCLVWVRININRCGYTHGWVLGRGFVGSVHLHWHTGTEVASLGDVVVCRFRRSLLSLRLLDELGLKSGKWRDSFGAVVEGGGR